MKEEDLEFIVSNLQIESKNTLFVELPIQGIGLFEIVIELGQNRKPNSEKLNNVIDFIIANLESLKLKSNTLLNSLADVKELSSLKVDPNIDFELIGVCIHNDDSIHNQFKLVFSYNQDTVHINEDILGYRTVNISGSSPQYYISGVNWIY